MFQNFSFEAGGRQINAACTFIRYEAETGGAVDATIRLRADGQDLGEWLPGDDVTLPAQVTRIDVVPVAGAVGKLRLGIGQVKTSRMVVVGEAATAISANVAARSAFTSSAKTATTASTQLVAANPARNYLLVQNNDPTGYVVVSFGAAAVLAPANGVRIAAGGFWEWVGSVPTNAANVIGNAANANLVVVEG
jgi:hypothetical protein